MHFEPPSSSLAVTVGIGLLSCALLGAWISLVWRAAPSGERTRTTGRFGGLLLAWALLTLGLASAGVFARIDVQPPPFLVVPLGLAVGTALLVRSRFGQLLATTPLWMLVGLQAFRLPLELIMHQAAVEGTMPAQMTFGAIGGRLGLNYDIVTGMTALLLAIVLRGRSLPRWLVLAWNVLGSALLLAIVVIGIGSTPLFARFGSTPADLNTWIFYPPFVWLPAVLVASALLGHVLVFRALTGAVGSSR